MQLSMPENWAGPLVPDDVRRTADDLLCVEDMLACLLQIKYSTAGQMVKSLLVQGPELPQGVWVSYEKILNPYSGDRSYTYHMFHLTELVRLFSLIRPLRPWMLKATEVVSIDLHPLALQLYFPDAHRTGTGLFSAADIIAASTGISAAAASKLIMKKLKLVPALFKGNCVCIELIVNPGSARPDQAFRMFSVDGLFQLFTQFSRMAKFLSFFNYVPRNQAGIVEDFVQEPHQPFHVPIEDSSMAGDDELRNNLVQELDNQVNVEDDSVDGPGEVAHVLCLSEHLDFDKDVDMELLNLAYRRLELDERRLALDNRALVLKHRGTGF